MTRRCCHLLMLVWLGIVPGCGGQPEPAPEAMSALPVEVPEPPAELSWDEQIAAVRTGQSTKIESSGQITPEQFAMLGEGCDGLVLLRLTAPQITDADLAVLPQLVALRQLVLFAPVGDAGMESIAACPSLEIVNLPRGVFTDAGLARLKELPLLTLLRFSSPNVTDAGLEHVAELSNLRFLHLLDVPVTDTGLDSVRRIKLLESFYIDGGACTDEGLSCLLKARPGLHLHVNQQHLSGDDAPHQH